MRSSLGRPLAQCGNPAVLGEGGTTPGSQTLGFLLMPRLTPAGGLVSEASDITGSEPHSRGRTSWGFGVGINHQCPSFCLPFFPLAHKLAGRDKGSMWDQLEDAAMETFSISNHLSLRAVFVPPLWEGLGLV